MSEESFSEKEVNQMLFEQKVLIRMDDHDENLSKLVTEFANHVKEEQYENEMLLAKVAEGANDRRQCEATLRREMYDTFVKKADLRMYAFLVITAVTATTGFITWLGAQSSTHAHDKSMAQVVDQITKLMEMERISERQQDNP